MKLGKTIAYLGLSLALVGGVVSQASAQEVDEAKVKAMFDSADTNKDTFVDKAEGTVFATQMLKAQTKGKLTDEQIKAAVVQIIKQVFEKVDANKDGKISFEELKAAKPPQQP